MELYQLLDPIKYKIIIEKVISASKAIRIWDEMIKSGKHSQADALIGGAEGLSLKLGLARMDKNGDGNISYAEYNAYMDDAQLMIDKVTNLLLNSGVVGALFTSFLYPQLFNYINVSDESQQFFGNTCIELFLYIYYALLMTSVSFGILLVFYAMRLFIYLNVWLDLLEAKLEYIQSVPFNVIAVLAILTINFSIWTIPFAVALSIKPGIALLIGIMTLLLFFGGNLFLVVYLFESQAGRILDDEVRIFLEKISPTDDKNNFEENPLKPLRIEKQ